MNDQDKRQREQDPNSNPKSEPAPSRDETKPRRMTLEELLEGMAPGEKSFWGDDDWPMGEELI